MSKKPKKIETDQGIITINKRELKVGEEVRIIVEPKEKYSKYKRYVAFAKTVICMSKKE